MQSMSKIVFTFAALACIAVGSGAFAHSTGHESRTKEGCQKLEGKDDDTKTERGACLVCIGKNSDKGKFHYHPDYPAGDRCKPDNGKPN